MERELSYSHLSNFLSELFNIDREPNYSDRNENVSVDTSSNDMVDEANVNGSDSAVVGTLKDGRKRMSCVKDGEKKHLLSQGMEDSEAVQFSDIPEGVDISGEVRFLGGVDRSASVCVENFKMELIEDTADFGTYEHKEEDDKVRFKPDELECKLSDDLADSCKTYCKVCGSPFPLNSMRNHASSQHKLQITRYKELYGPLEIIEKVFHKCHLCEKILLMDSDAMGGHIKGTHKMKESVYKERFMINSKKVKALGKYVPEELNCKLIDKMFENIKDPVDKNSNTMHGVSSKGKEDINVNKYNPVEVDFEISDVPKQSNILLEPKKMKKALSSSSSSKLKVNPTMSKVASKGISPHVELNCRLSDDPADGCKTLCKVCGFSFNLSSMRTHTLSQHKLQITRYKELYGPFEIIEKVFHKCHLCQKILLLERDVLGGHVKRIHKMKEKEYNERFLISPHKSTFKPKKRKMASSSLKISYYGSMSNGNIEIDEKIFLETSVIVEKLTAVEVRKYMGNHDDSVILEEGFVIIELDDGFIDQEDF